MTARLSGSAVQSLGALSGVVVPFGLRRGGVDPALAASILVTTITDVIGFLLFLGLATAVLQRSGILSRNSIPARRPSRMTDLPRRVGRRHPNSASARVKGLPAYRRLHQYRYGHRLLIHALPGKVETVLHPTLKNQASNERIVENIKFPERTADWAGKSPVVRNRVTPYSPDFSESRSGQGKAAKR